MICKTCLLNDDKPGIELDENGICNYCHWQDGMEKKYKKLTENELTEAMMMHRETGDNEYDCIIGVSGGVDSSYLLTKAVLEWRLNPLAVTFDDGWNTKTATDNIRTLVDKLGVDLYSYVVDYEEMNDIYRSFILAGVPDTDAPTDIAIAKVLRMAAKENDVKYILDAHNFRTEGTTPLGWLYFDGRYVESVHNAYGRLAWSKTNKNGGGFPNLTMRDMMWDNTRKIRPLYYMDYSRERAIEWLKLTGWKPYDQHHGENLWTLFSNYVWMPEKFDLDLREVFYSAQIRSGILTREHAEYSIMKRPLDMMNRPHLIKEVQLRLDIPGQLEDIMNEGVIRTHCNFKTYKEEFKRLSLLFWAMKKLGLVNETFYKKYCEGI
jgi:tRNA(Ile)-lysidine synthase TilS/MesJ